MPSFKGLDYDKHPEITTALNEFIFGRLKTILSGQITKEFVDMITIFTSKNYSNDWANIKEEVSETFAVS